MKYMMLLFVPIFTMLDVTAQNISLRKDTVFKGGTALAILKKKNPNTRSYAILSLTGKELIEIHYSHLNSNGKLLYIVTFMNDHGQAMIAKQPGFPLSFVKEVIKDNLISKEFVNNEPELQFIKTHSLPMGYTDVAEIRDYTNKTRQ